MNPTPPTILLTFDVEDWFQVENLRPLFPPTTWDSQELRVERNTHKLLDLLDSITISPLNQTNLQPVKFPSGTSEANFTGPTNPRATFFILGWIAQRLPNLVREIQKRGHEVASHGYNHLMCNQLNLKDLQQDLIRSKKTIEDITGNQVHGYRAPNFSISDKALDLIQTACYRYDSSYNNFAQHGRYGTITLNGHMYPTPAIQIKKDFTELPISNLKIGKHIIPWGGGGYFRLLPPPVFKAGVRHILRKTNTYTFYIHPWELDPHQPKTRNPKRLAGWKHYLNLHKTQTRLYDLIKTFNRCNYPTCSQYINQLNNQTQRTKYTL
jgi:polysaccharide deacetylase family protein (PEP-CTERM system associated)